MDYTFSLPFEQRRTQKTDRLPRISKAKNWIKRSGASLNTHLSLSPFFLLLQSLQSNIQHPKYTISHVAHGGSHSKTELISYFLFSFSSIKAGTRLTVFGQRSAPQRLTLPFPGSPPAYLHAFTHSSHSLFFSIFSLLSLTHKTPRRKEGEERENLSFFLERETRF